MYDNRLTADQLAALAPGDTVIADTNRGTWSGYDTRPVTVARLTRTQLVVHEPGPRGPIESRFNRSDGSQIGDRGWLLDTEQVDQWVASYGAALASLADDEYDDAHRNPEGGH
jgi:hypothetical protein